MPDFDEVFSLVDRLLADHRLDNDHRAFAQVCLALSAQVSDGFDDEEKAAIECAHRYWANHSDADLRSYWVSRLAERLDAYAHKGLANSRRESFCRLAWSTLNTNTGLSQQAGEFLVKLGSLIGLTPGQVESAFRTISVT